MPVTPPYTAESIAAVKKHITAAQLTRPAAVKLVGARFNLGERQAREVYKRFLEGSEIPKLASPAAPSLIKDISGDKATYTLDGYDIQTIDDVIKLCNVDRQTWATKRFSVGQRADGHLRWNASFERNKNMSQTFVDQLKEDLKAVVVAPPKTKRAPVKGGRLLEIAAFDLHLGKLGWKPETGADYDIKIARDDFFKALHELVEKAQKQGPISRILFPVGNDYLTIDSDSNETTAGTPQDVDSRFTKIYREGRKILVEAIEMLRQIAPVDVMVVAGNHDHVSMFHLGDALECWFHAHDDVKVFNEPISRKYYRFGKVLLCFCHGHLEKQDSLHGLAATEQPVLWAATTYREWHLGHLHHQIVKEHMGTIVRVLSSLSGPDRYHHDRGYVGAKRVAQAFLFNEETGLDAIFQSTPVES